MFCAASQLPRGNSSEDATVHLLQLFEKVGKNRDIFTNGYQTLNGLFL